MPIVKSNNSADIKIVVAAEMDKASAEQVKAQVNALSSTQRKLIEDQVINERKLAEAENKRLGKLRELEAAQNKYRASLMKSREEAEKLQQVSMRMAAAGAAILAPFIAATAKFAATANKSDEVANRYRASMKSMEDSTVRIGRATADVLNPALEKTAEMMSDIAGVLERNPALVQGALAVGGGLVAVGTIGTVVAQIKMITATLAVLTGAGSAAAGATATGGAAVAGGAAAGSAAQVFGLAAAAAFAAYFERQIAEKILGKDVGRGAAFVLTAGLSELIPNIINMIGNGGGAGKGVTAATPLTSGGTPAGPGGMSALQAMERGIDLQKLSLFNTSQIANQKLAAEMASNQKRLEATKTFEANRASIEKAISDLTSSFLKADRQAHQDYYNQRKDITRQAGIDAQRMEEDHQRNIEKIQRDSDARLVGLVQDRDALGIVQEKRNAENQRKEAENAYQVEMRRRHQDVAERLRIMDREFRIANQRRLAEYEYNLKIKQAEMTAAQNLYTAIVNGAMVAKNQIDQIFGSTTKPGSPPPSTNGLVTKRALPTALVTGSTTQPQYSTGGQVAINNNFGGTVSIRQVAQMIDYSAQSIMRSIEKSIQMA